MVISQIIGQWFEVKVGENARVCRREELSATMAEMGAKPADPAGIERWASMADIPSMGSLSITLADGSVLRLVSPDEIPAEAVESAIRALADFVNKFPTLFWDAVKTCNIAGPRSKPHRGCRMALSFTLPAVSVFQHPFEYGKPDLWFWCVYSPNHTPGEPQEVVARSSMGISSQEEAWDQADAAARAAGWRLA